MGEMESTCKQEAKRAKCFHPAAEQCTGTQRLWIFRSPWSQHFPPMLPFMSTTEWNPAPSPMFLRLHTMALWSLDLKKNHVETPWLWRFFLLYPRPDNSPVSGSPQVLDVPLPQNVTYPGSDTSVYHWLKSRVGLPSLSIPFCLSLNSIIYFYSRFEKNQRLWKSYKVLVILDQSTQPTKHNQNVTPRMSFATNDRLKKFFYLQAAFEEDCVLFTLMSSVPRCINVFSLKNEGIDKQPLISLSFPNTHKAHK